MAYDDALSELYQVPLAQFVAERKRLAGDLKASGDTAGAKQLLERKRPPVSAWVVNQLYWHARDVFDEMLATAEQLRKGHLKASADHREAIAKLRKRAATILEDSGHTANEATLRRVATTLSALSATGSFEPDLPGTLAADRDPPGFEAAVMPIVEDEEAAEPSTPAPHARREPAKPTVDEAELRRHAELAEQRRQEEARKRRQAERHRVEAALRTANGELEVRERAIKQLEKQLEDAKQRVADAREAVDDIAAKLAELTDD